MISAHTFGLLCMIAYVTSVNAAYTCLSCESAIAPTACDSVTLCGEHEVCSIEMYLNHMGGIRYRLGCKDTQQCVSHVRGSANDEAQTHDFNQSGPGHVSSILAPENLTTALPTIDGNKQNITDSVNSAIPVDYEVVDDKADFDSTVMCSECCSGNICNSAGCGKEGFGDRSSRGPICFVCPDQGASHDCDIIRVCSIDQICMLRLKESSIGQFTEYETKCERKEACSKVFEAFNPVSSNLMSETVLVGKRYFEAAASGKKCNVKCCDLDLCNAGDDCNMTPTSHTTATTDDPSSTPYLNLTIISGSLVTTSNPSTVKTTTPFNACNFHPCKSGRCESNGHYYMCHCTVEYTGTNCETLIPPTTTPLDTCLTNPCIFGSCIPNGNTYLCNCNPGYNGTKCEKVIPPTTTPLDPCLANPCRFGSCKSNGTTYVCNCNAGYNGTNCEELIPPTTTAIDPCLSNPCIFGSCASSGNTYMCNCRVEYTGTNCDTLIPTTTTELPSCFSNPCHHGECREYGTTYKCTCKVGAYGRNCEHVVITTAKPTVFASVSPCLSNPCVHGNCFESHHTYYCACPEGNYGRNCELGHYDGPPIATTKATTTAPHPCQPNPCLHHGTCTVTESGDYQCQCKPGLTGTTCDTIITTTTAKPTTTKTPGVYNRHTNCHAPHEIAGIAGLATSHKHPGLLYAVNDDGASAKVFVFNTSCHLQATYFIHGAHSNDWEDMGLGPCPHHHNKSCIYIADSGSHDDERERKLYYFEEPNDVKNQDVNVQDTIHYSFHHHDCEAIMVDPQARIFMVCGRTLVMIPESGWDHFDQFVLGDLHIHSYAQGGDISDDGKQILVQDLDNIYYWNMGSSNDVGAVLKSPPTVVSSYHKEPNGESVAWEVNSNGFFTLSGGDNQPLYHFN